ncbi:Helicase protein with RING/U-box domain [Hibiscus syriacus]|uniref:Helicase protein with RING/U-box domain n=1 Tax=Hibiscus syriacus TaxID=106335 RepID=A0A6A3CW40_HIBSY|nr:Helicase protein with RING/U-box domain [Hibiscus syriacus]
MRRPSRLQHRAPASLKINPVSSWNIAIPLLSPLASSPPSIDPWEEPPRQEQKPRQNQKTEPEKLVFKMWQHPAAPFCCEPAPLVPSFVPV